MEHFRQLKINENSSKDDIKKAYYKLILKHHPDKGGNNETFIEIKRAYESLLINSIKNKTTHSSPINNNKSSYSTSNYNNKSSYSSPINNNKSSYSSSNNTNKSTHSSSNNNNKSTYSSNTNNTYSSPININSKTNKFKNNVISGLPRLPNWVSKRFSKSNILGTLFAGYIALRHTLPKQDRVYNKYTYFGDKLAGDRLVGYSVVNCILFDRVETWYDGDSCYPTTSYFWRRTNFIFNDK